MPVLVRAGHIPDANTVALWRLDDLSAAAAVDLKGSYPATSGTGYQSLDGADAQVGRARYFNQTGELIFGADAALRNLIAGFNWTIEFWLYTIASSIHSNGFQTYLSMKTGANSVFQFGSYTLGSRYLVGDSVNALQPIGPGTRAPYLDTFAHFGLTKVSASGGTQQLWRLYVNGADTGTLNLPNVGIPSSAGMDFVMGRGSSWYGHCLLDDVRISNVVRSPAEILASYERGSLGTIVQLPVINVPSNGATVQEELVSPIAAGPVTISGTAHPSFLVSLFENGAQLGDAVVADLSTGEWELVLDEMLLGEHSIHAEQEDTFGEFPYSSDPVELVLAPPGSGAYPWEMIPGDATGDNVVRDLGLDAYEELYIDENGDIALTYGRASVLSDIIARLRTHRGEWFLHTSLGVPYVERIFVKNPDTVVIRSIIREEIEATPGVLALSDLQLDYAETTRALSITFRVSTDMGELSGQVEV